MIALKRSRRACASRPSGTSRPHAAHLRDDPVDDLHQVVVVAERDGGLLHLAAALDIDVLRPVDQDVADRRVLQQHLERPQAEGLVEHLVDERSRSLRLSSVSSVSHRCSTTRRISRAARRPASRPRASGRAVDQLAVDALFQLFKARFLGFPRARREPSRRIPCMISLGPATVADPVPSRTPNAFHPRRRGTAAQTSREKHSLRKRPSLRGWLCRRGDQRICWPALPHSDPAACLSGFFRCGGLPRTSLWDGRKLVGSSNARRLETRRAETPLTPTNGGCFGLTRGRLGVRIPPVSW